MQFVPTHGHERGTTAQERPTSTAYPYGSSSYATSDHRLLRSSSRADGTSRAIPNRVQRKLMNFLTPHIVRKPSALLEPSSAAPAAPHLSEYAFRGLRIHRYDDYGHYVLADAEEGEGRHGHQGGAAARHPDPSRTLC
ncbi:unnamed protein product, partial [Amoebophrya sp. A120]|eukprot:GSA120T00010516001.1